MGGVQRTTAVLDATVFDGDEQARSGYRIPFNRPWLTGREGEYLDWLSTSRQLSGDGPFTKTCEALLTEELGVERSLLTTSCTHALEMAALLLEIAPGDEVICPSFTFVSTINAFVLRGARPVFCDIRPDTLNIDERQIEGLITPRTRVVVPVHYAGVACEMDEITSLCVRHGIAMVEDNALGLFGKYKERCLGTFGTLGALSFHETKSFSCGEGGALLINDPSLTARAEILREKGTNRTRFFRGEVDKYTWVDVGSSYLPSDILAAFLLAQLEARNEILQRRSRIWRTYYEGLSGWAKEVGAELPTVPDECEQAYALFYLLLPSADLRKRLIEHLRALGILSVFHYLPLHLSPMGQRRGGRPGQLPVTEHVSPRLLRLPFYNDLQPHEQDAVISAIVDDDWA